MTERQLVGGMVGNPFLNCHDLVNGIAAAFTQVFLSGLYKQDTANGLTLTINM